jgi:hypothetical protein
MPTPTLIGSAGSDASAASAAIARPQRTAALTESKTTKKLSPSVLISAPPWRSIAARTNFR